MFRSLIVSHTLVLAFCTVAAGQSSSVPISASGVSPSSLPSIIPSSNSSSNSSLCNAFKQRYPGRAFTPDDAQYKSENEHFWSSASFLGPACVVTPSNATELSEIVLSLRMADTKFAFRGSGHMPIADAANIAAPGVLISSTNLTQLELTKDKQYVSIGPGNRWNNVYKYLEPYGLATIGGRLGVVGTSGFILGGGVSFFGNEHGFASSNIRAVECVLSNGMIVEATANNTFSDLFWALKGGGNSFCLVTRFDLKVLNQPTVQVGSANYGTNASAPFFDAVQAYAENGTQDVKSAVIPLVQYGAALNASAPQYTSFLFYSGNETNPPGLAPFQQSSQLKAVSNTYSRRSMYNWTTELDPEFSILSGFRNLFYVNSIVAKKDAMTRIHDTFFTAAKQVLGPIPDAIAGVAFMPLGEQFFEMSKGDPQGIDPDGSPYVWVEQSITWNNPANDKIINDFVASVNRNISSQLQAMNYSVPYLYLNDANATQPVFQGYPKENVARLKEIRRKYDPDMVYTKLMPGGWKVETV